MQNFNIHTHTERCNHAVGSDEEYVLAAIKNNLKVLGFSDHVPYIENKPFGDRMQYHQCDSYIESIAFLKEKYKSEIQILTGFECEYFEKYDAYYEELLTKVDYLILGQHYGSNTGIDYDVNCSDERVLEYANTLCDGIKSGYFTYVAHPDYFMLPRDHWSAACTQAMHLICKTAKQYNIPLEINLKGLSYGKQDFKDETTYYYPHKNTVAIMEEYGNTCVYGLDCHDPAFYWKMTAYIEEFMCEYKMNHLQFVTDINQLIHM